jgi:hypothetical protein
LIRTSECGCSIAAAALATDPGLPCVLSGRVRVDAKSKQSLDERAPLLAEDLLPQSAPNTLLSTLPKVRCRVAAAPPPRARRKRDSDTDRRHQDALRAILDEATERMINVNGPSPFAEVYDTTLSASPSLRWRPPPEGSTHSMKTVRRQKHSDSSEADMTCDTVDTFMTATDGEHNDFLRELPVSNEEDRMVGPLMALFQASKALADASVARPNNAGCLDHAGLRFWGRRKLADCSYAVNTSAVFSQLIFRAILGSTCLPLARNTPSTMQTSFHRSLAGENHDSQSTRAPLGLRNK